METNFYDGTKLLSLLDIDGNKPEIYICTSNRSAGKTTFFGRLCINRFKDKKEKFALLYRFNYELDNCADKFFKDISNIFFTQDKMVSKSRARGMYHELFLNDELCGYAIALNNADQIKKYSHFFSDVSRVLFDEFQSETNKYCPNEIKKFISVHISMARGNNKQVRYLPIYMISNPVSIINPYYVAMGISDRLNTETKFLRGNGFVLEQGYVQSASEAQKTSAFNRAFENDSYMDYNMQGVYLNDNLAFIEKPTGKSTYIVTIRYNGCDYAIREYSELGFLYCDNKADLQYPLKIAVTTDDHNINYVMLKHNDFIISNLRFYFDKGCFRFKDLKCKEAILKTLSY